MLIRHRRINPPHAVRQQVHKSTTHKCTSLKTAFCAFSWLLFVRLINAARHAANFERVLAGWAFTASRILSTSLYSLLYGSNNIILIMKKSRAYVKNASVAAEPKCC